MAIIEFEEATAANPWTQEVADLLAAGENKASSITVPLKDKTKARNQFGKAANAVGKTARLKGETITGETPAEGAEDTRTVTLVFVLTKLNAKAGKVIGPRATDTPAEAQAEADAEAQVDATPAKGK